MRRQLRGEVKKAVFRVVKHNSDRLNALVAEHNFHIARPASVNTRLVALLTRNEQQTHRSMRSGCQTKTIELFNIRYYTRTGNRRRRIGARINSYFESASTGRLFPETWRLLSETVQAAGASQRFINTTNSGKYAFLDRNTEKEGKRKLLR